MANSKDSVSQKNTARLAWLDGLKGLACFGVFTHHFFLANFPSSYYGAEMPSLLPGGVDTLFSYKPYGVFLNGNFWVCLFLLISAYLPACQIMRTPDDKLRSRAGTMILKRYPRLMLPTFSVAVINFILLHILNALHMNYINKPLDYSVGGLLMHGLVLMWTKADGTLIGPFWTLHYFLLVPLFAMLLAIPARRENRFMPCIYAGLLIAFFEYDILFDYYMAGVLGVLLADLTCHDRFAFLTGRFPALRRKMPLLLLSLLLLLTGLWLGGYPSYVEPEGLYRHFMVLDSRNNGVSVLLHIAGAFLLLCAMHLWKAASLPDLLSAGPFQFLGAISFPIYMIHMPWIEYLGYYLMDRFRDLTGSAAHAAFPVYLILLILVLLSAWLFHSTIEKWCERFCQKISI
ncbi:MAG: acyltransferase [Lachnospiraceae bacterium]|nr:acyltransferase [Lachnospiraceae bacterium]